MNISKTHLKQAHLFLNSSIIVQIPAFLSFLFILVYSEKQIMVFVAPFLIYSLFLFQNYLLNYKRFLCTSKKIDRKRVVTTDILSSPQLLVYFSKEESELLLFLPSGELMGRIIKAKPKNFQRLFPKEFLLIDDKDNQLASYYLTNRSIDVIQYKKGYIGSFSLTKNSTKKGEFQLLSGEIVGTLKSETIYLDDKIENANQQLVIRLKKGWMSLDSQEIFGNPNTPVLTISSSLDEREKLLYISLLLKRFYKS